MWNANTKVIIDLKQSMNKVSHKVISGFVNLPQPNPRVIVEAFKHYNPVVGLYENNIRQGVFLGICDQLNNSN